MRTFWTLGANSQMSFGHRDLEWIRNAEARAILGGVPNRLDYFWMRMAQNRRPPTFRRNPHIRFHPRPIYARPWPCDEKRLAAYGTECPNG